MWDKGYDSLFPEIGAQFQQEDKLRRMTLVDTSSTIYVVEYTATFPDGNVIDGMYRNHFPVAEMAEAFITDYARPGWLVARDGFADMPDVRFLVTRYARIPF